MKNKRLIASLFLSIIVIFLVLGCTSSITDEQQSLADKIQLRISTRDFNVEKKAANPYDYLRKQAKKVHKFYQERHPNFKLPRNPNIIAKNAQDKALFRFVQQMPFETWGIEDPTELQQTIYDMYQYHQGQVSLETVQSYVQSINTVLIQYPLDYEGTYSFFNQQQSNGAVSSADYAILESWFNGLVASNSISESIAITTMVEQEILNANTSGHDLLLGLTSTANGLFESQAISMSPSDQYYFQKTAAVAMIIGGAIAIIGIAMVVITDTGSGSMNYQQQNWLGAAFIGALIFTCAAISED